MPERRLDNAGLLMKKFLLKICIYTTIICVLISVFAAPAFATGDVVQFSEAAKLGASIVDLYGMANNTSLAYDVSSNQSALTVIENLYTEYSSNASDPYTLAAIGAAAAAAGAIAVIYDAVTGQGYIQLYQEQYLSSLDGYWDYQLIDAGLVRDQINDLFYWSLNQNNTVNPIIIFSDSSYYFDSLPYLSGFSDNYSYFEESLKLISGVYRYNNSINQYYGAYIKSNNYDISIGYVSNLDRLFAISLSPYDINNTRYCYIESNNPSVVNFSPFDAYTSYNYNGTTLYISSIPYSFSTINDIYINSQYQSETDLYNAYIDVKNNPSNNLIDTEIVNIGPYWGDPLEHPLEITIPDNSDPNYEPTPRRITTTIPWDPTWGDPLPDGVSEPEYGVPYPITDPALLNTVVPEIWDDIVANDVQIQTDSTPSDPDSPVEEVMVPFLPLEIPSFNFSLSGIWHYVVSWVQSLGSWFTAMFAMWSCLPYAMVVPVYATLVVVIVLGLYKRFIA